MMISVRKEQCNIYLISFSIRTHSQFLTLQIRAFLQQNFSTLYIHGAYWFLINIPFVERISAVAFYLEKEFVHFTKHKSSCLVITQLAQKTLENSLSFPVPSCVSPVIPCATPVSSCTHTLCDLWSLSSTVHIPCLPLKAHVTPCTFLYHPLYGI